MILYHVSNIGGIHYLEPKVADHERPYVYMNTIDTMNNFNIMRRKNFSDNI